MEIKYSKVFGYRTYRVLNIVEDFCLNYYNEDFYCGILNLRNQLIENIQLIIDRKTQNHTDIDEVRLDTCFENSVNEILKCDKYPNGKYNFPDHVIHDNTFGNIYFDTKSVLCNETDNSYEVNYNNSGGQINAVTENILRHWEGKDNKYYKSFIIFVYYNISNNNVKVLDVMIVPTIYALKLRKYNWNDLSTIKFASKSNTNLQIPLGLPSFTQKTGMETLEEKECLIATAIYNYINKL